MARVFEAIVRSSDHDPEYAGRFLQSYDFSQVLELPAGYEPRALPAAPSDPSDSAVPSEMAIVARGYFASEQEATVEHFADADFGPSEALAPYSGYEGYTEVEHEAASYVEAEVVHDEAVSVPTPTSAALSERGVAHPAASRPSARPAVGEEFKRLRGAVLSAAQARRLQVIVVCGVAPGDGATYVANNLGLALSELDKLNVARFEVSGEAQHTPARPGHGGESYQLRLRRGEAPNLREIVSPDGNVSLNDLLRLCDIPAMMEKLKDRFDFILIDLPAVTTHPESAVLAAQADGVILVAQQGETKCARLGEARAALQKARAEVLGVVLNRRREALPKTLARAI